MRRGLRGGGRRGDNEAINIGLECKGGNMAAKKKRTKRGKATVERKYEVRTEIANFTHAKAPRAALSPFRSRTGRHVRVAALAGATAH